MRRVVSFFTCALLALAGCENTGGLGERFKPAEPQRQEYEASLERVHASARNALVFMGFKVTRASAARGTIEAVNAVRADAQLRGASQVSVKVRLESTLDGGTVMEVWMTEIVEDAFTGAGGYGTRTPLKASPLYDVLFRESERLLQTPEN
ncbi:MAG: hypothetical protein RIS54_2073 [Verrucomicrobiota bacterium]|jgi:hypothetical protein